jgi:glycosyltransferase involved in cell wall biosynthesis
MLPRGGAVEMTPLSEEDKCHVTFVVIAYNESAGIIECLETILGQDSIHNFKVVVVDDGSTDGTGKLVATRFDKQIQVISQPNLGRGAARQTGLAQSRSEYVAMVDSDIHLPKDWLARCMSQIEGKVGVGGIAVPDGDCSTMHRLFNLSPKNKPGSVSVAGSNALFLTEVLRTAGTSWVTPLGEDFRLNKLLVSKGFDLNTVPGLFVRHIEHKSYRNSLRWLYKSGHDATNLWFEFRELRGPDVAASAFLVVTVLSVALLPSFGGLILLTPFLFCTAVGTGHLNSKFYANENFPGFVKAILPNSILMGAYLLGRQASLIQNLGCFLKNRIDLLLRCGKNAL